MTASPIDLVIACAVFAAVVFFLPRLFAKANVSVRMTRSLRRLRTARHDDLSLVSSYHEAVTSTASAAVADLAPAPSAPIDERTCRDLDLDDVFTSLDFAESEPGRQYLYHMLRCPQEMYEPLQRLDQAARSLSEPETGEQVRDALRHLGDRRAAYLPQLIFGALPARPPLWWLFPMLTACSLTCLASIVFWNEAALVWLGVCVVNAGVQLVYRPRVKHLVVALHQMPAFLRTARELGELNTDELANEQRVLRDGAQQLSSLRRATSWLMFEPSQSSEMAGWLYEYVNLLFLFDVNAFVFTTDTLRTSRAVTRQMFEAIGYIDAAQSIGRWRRTLPRWSTPEFTEAQSALHADSIAHPLLAEPVPNSIALDGTGLVITGSNMSGKTTFIRALGVNAVLAQTLATVCADRWRAPLLRVRTSIGREDSLMDGKSYYLAEVESILSLLNAKTEHAQHLFLLDEIFRGTNTTERVAAGYAVLQHLNAGHDFVVAATHDIEVLDLLGAEFRAHHFREQVKGDELTFDFLLRPGPASTRNAIALLRLMRYPDSLVQAALDAINWRT